MTAKKQGPDHVVIDAAAFEWRKTPTEVLTTFEAICTEIPESGTKKQVLWLLCAIGHSLARPKDSEHEYTPIPEAAYRWLGNALLAISRGECPKRALGLNRKTKHTAAYRRLIEYLVADLQRQGVTLHEAESLVGSYDPHTKTFRADPDDKAAARIRKVINRKIRTK